MIHVVAQEATVNGEGTKPGFVPGYGVIPPAMVRELAKTAQLKPIVVPKDALAEPQYRPSTALAEFVRSRDLTCRWPGCDTPAWQADIDHTVPYPFGPTHPSNNACFCRFHHLMKTFHGGPGGWNVIQQPDGTMVFTTPSGRVHTTEPFGAMLFPQLALPTGELDLPEQPPPDENRGLKMPKRKRTRAQERAYRIQRERNAMRPATPPTHHHSESRRAPRRRQKPVPQGAPGDRRHRDDERGAGHSRRAVHQRGGDVYADHRGDAGQPLSCGDGGPGVG